ncbi:WD repeat-containing protein JIP5 [Leucoagaricus sp. SymC.cos]|nr:WD repeat-containing protein JIP5 [Leucoagaricus sp. SymC.cos]
MPEIPVDAQIFDIVFHPTSSTVFAGLLTGYVKAFAYDQQGNYQNVFSLRPSKKSCRGLSISEVGSKLYAVGKSKSLHIIDTKTEQIETRTGAHESAINRVKTLTPWLLTTGDDEGVIKLWDPRRKEAVRTYTHHFDYISDFLWLEDKKQLVATSGDGTLSVMDVRSKKPQPFAQSEDQEDELLSIVTIKG